MNSRGEVLIEFGNSDPLVTFHGDVTPEDIHKAIYFLRVQYGADYMAKKRQAEVANEENRRREIELEQQKIEIEKKECARRERELQAEQAKAELAREEAETEEVKAANRKVEAQRLAIRDEQERQRLQDIEEAKLRAQERLLELRKQAQEGRNIAKELDNE